MLVATLLIWRHVAFWRLVKVKSLEERDATFFCRQFRRRMLTSAMIGVVGMAILVAEWLRSPLMSILYLIGLALLVVWILLMALMDLLSTRRQLQRMQKSQLSRRVELQTEIDRLRQMQRAGDDNGKSNQ